MGYGKFLSPGRRAVYNTANYVVKRALGAATALAASKGLRKSAKSKTSGKYRSRKAMKSKFRSYNSITMTKRRKTVRQNHSNENKVVSLQVPARNPSAMKMVMCAMEPQWYRTQGLSQFDTTSGFYPVANRTDASAANILPIHVWDLTSSPNWNGASVNVQAGFGLYTSSTGGALAYNLNGQNESGTTVASAQWILENTSGGQDDLPKRKSFHHWSHIKMNLYGVRKRATRFLVQLVMVKEEYADFISAADTNVEKKKLYDYLARPFIFNNLNAGDPQTANHIKILKTYETIVSPISTDEYSGSTAVPHIQTVNWFINHNRIRRYDWKKDNPPAIAMNAGFDVETATGHDTRVDPKSRVYLVIRALSPERKTVTNALDAADPITEPSYDLVIRNKFSNPT